MSEQDQKRECPNGCGETMQPDTIDKPTPRPDGTFVLVRDLEVYRCNKCGEIFIPASSLRKVKQILENSESPDEIDELPVYHLKAS